MIFCILLAVAVPLFAEEPTQLDVLLLEENFHPELLRFTATLAPLREAELAFEVPGEVNTRPAELGQRVEPGQELLTLNPRRFKIQKQLRNAELQGAQSQFELAELNFHRSEILYRDSTLSQEAVDQSRYQRDTAQSLRDVARARLALARLDLMASSIRAPFAGEVAALHVEIGERVAAGQAALRLAARDTVILRAHVSATALNKLKIGLSAKVEPADGRPAFFASITHIGQVADPTSRRYPIELLAADPGGPLGILASLTVTSEQDLRGVELPATALRFRSNRAYTYIVAGSGNSGELVERQVEIGAELSGGRFFITDGLAPGDRVVEFGSVPFAPGQTVQIARTRRLQQERVGR